MNTEPGIAELLPRIERSIERVREAVQALTLEQASAPLLGEGRSVKDVLGHLAWWDQWLLTTLPPAPGDAPPAIQLPLADQIPPLSEWSGVDEMNAKVLDYNRARPYAEIFAEWSSAVELLWRRVCRLTDEDLYDPNGMSARIGLPVAPNIKGIYEHYEEHAHEFEQLGAQLK